MHWTFNLGIAFLAFGIIFMIIGYDTTSRYQQYYDRCNSLLGEGAQFLFNEADESCNQANSIMQTGTILNGLGIGLIVIGIISMIVGAMKHDDELTNKRKYYYS